MLSFMFNVIRRESASHFSKGMKGAFGIWYMARSAGWLAKQPTHQLGWQIIRDTRWAGWLDQAKAWCRLVGLGLWGVDDRAVEVLDHPTPYLLEGVLTPSPGHQRLGG